jgi:imidazole glycerol phosphate synthase subunit HisF
MNASTRLTFRIIPCLDVAAGRVVKGIQFKNLRDQGDPAECALRYAEQGADEIVFLDITAAPERRQTNLEWVSRAAEQVFIPLSVGGGVREPEDARRLLLAGADKVLLTSIDSDGMKHGYDLDLLSTVSALVPVPVIASGGAGSIEHLAEALRVGSSAVLAASIFHESTFTVLEIKQQLAAQGFRMRLEASV